MNEKKKTTKNWYSDESVNQLIIELIMWVKTIQNETNKENSWRQTTKKKKKWEDQLNIVLCK